MSRSRANWAAFFERSDPKNIARRRKRGEKLGARAGKTVNTTPVGIVLPRMVGDAPLLEFSCSKSHIQRNAEKRRANPTGAEAKLQRVLNTLNGGILRGRFRREYCVSGKWIVDFYFPEIRLALEVDGPIHDTYDQRIKDRLKDADCERFDITVVRVSNAEVFGDRGRLVEKLRAGWRAAKGRRNNQIRRPAQDRRASET